MNNATPRTGPSCEEYYDDVIAPKLAELGRLCDEQGIGMAAFVEYEPEYVGSTMNKAAQLSNPLMAGYRAVTGKHGVTAFAVTITNPPEATP